MTVDTALQYLGLRRAPGAVRTRADRVVSAVMILAVLATLFATRHLDFWPRLMVAAAMMALFGVALGAGMVWVARRTDRTHRG